jgi:hypothetical protein
MYFPNSFVELIKIPTHLRERPGDVVHQGRNFVIKFFLFILHAYVSFLIEIFLLYGVLLFMLI